MRVDALVVKTQTTGEYDRLATLYTEQFGKLTAIAKGALKPHSVQGMQLDTFNLVSFELISGRGVPIIAAAQCQQAFGNIRHSLSALAVGCFFMEVLDKLVFDHERDRRLWELYIDILTRLNSGTVTDYLGLLRHKQNDLLSILGYGAHHEVIADGTAVARSFADGRSPEASFDRFYSLPLLYAVLASSV